MRLTFLGAAGMVTGSCYLLEAGGMRVLVDCGMFQGKEEELNRQPFSFAPATLDAVLLTHAHIDHSGRLPLLYKTGFRGPIYTHPATAKLAAVMLLDSAHIQEMEAERENRKAMRAGRGQVEPLYGQAEALAVSELFKPVPYGRLVRLNDRLEVRLQDAGHILGSALIEVFEYDETGRKTKLVFSGDLGQPERPILQDPTPVEEADYLICESTYGAKLHETRQSTRDQLAEVIRATVAKGGNVVIPAFAVGRAQEVLYEMNGLIESGQLPRNLKVVLDSPLAIKATEVTEEHWSVFDAEAASLIKNGDQPFRFPGLVVSETAEDSKALNNAKQPMVIIAASGMCEAGRVLHHLKHNLWRSVSTVLFVGYQAEGSLGRRILEGATRVRIHGEDVAVKARIESLQGLSAHADQTQLLHWIAGLKQPPRQTILIHGEDEGRQELARKLTEQGHRILLPVMGQSITLQPVAAGKPAARKQPPKPARVALAEGAALGLSARRMAAVLKEVQALRKAWNANGPHLPPEQAAELVKRADELLQGLEEMKRIIDSAGE